MSGSQEELGTFAQSSVALHHPLNPKFQTLFQPCNLMGAVQLIEDFNTHVTIDWSPRKAVKTGRRHMSTSNRCLEWGVGVVLAHGQFPRDGGDRM